MSFTQHGEFATDYIELRRDFTAAPFVPYESEQTYPSGHAPVAAGDRHGFTDFSAHDTTRLEETPQNELLAVSEKTGDDSMP